MVFCGKLLAELCYVPFRYLIFHLQNQANVEPKMTTVADFALSVVQLSRVRLRLLQPLVNQMVMKCEW